MENVLSFLDGDPVIFKRTPMEAVSSNKKLIFNNPESLHVKQGCPFWILRLLGSKHKLQQGFKPCCELSLVP